MRRRVAFGTSIAPRGRTPVEIARRLKEAWDIEVTFHRDMRWTLRDRGLLLVPVRELAVVTGEEDAVPDPSAV